MRRTLLSATVLVPLLALGACSTPDAPAPGDAGASAPPADPSASAESTSPKPTESTSPPDVPTAATVSVRISGDRVTPNAAQLDLASGEPVVFDIESDRAGELHVHSKPEQYVEFGAGRTRAEISIDTPGSVEVEEHDTSAVVAILEVR